MNSQSGKLRVVLIGAGRFGAKRARAIASHQRSQLIVVADQLPERAQALAHECGCAAETDWRRAAARDDVDAVVVSTPTQMLGEAALFAIQSGKHTLVEKPFGRTSEEAHALVEAARTCGICLKVGYNHRYHPAIQRAHEFFLRGVIGRPLFLRCIYGHGGRPGYDREWRAQAELSGGGELLDQGVHALDLFRWYLGDFDEVTAMVSTAFWPIAPAEDNVFALLRASCGAVAQLHASWTNWRNIFAFEVFGDTGYLQASGLGGSYGPERLCWGRQERPGNVPEEEWTDFPGPDDSLEREWDEFLNAIAEGREPASSGKEAWQTLRLAEAVYRSARDGRAVQLKNRAKRESNALSAAR